MKTLAMSLLLISNFAFSMQQENLKVYLYPGQELKSLDESHLTIVKCTQRCTQQQFQQQQQLCGMSTLSMPTIVNLRVRNLDYKGQHDVQNNEEIYSLRSRNNSTVDIICTNNREL